MNQPTVLANNEGNENPDSLSLVWCVVAVLLVLAAYVFAAYTDGHTRTDAAGTTTVSTSHDISNATLSGQNQE
jgi:hypothetical protein